MFSTPGAPATTPRWALTSTREEATAQRPARAAAARTSPASSPTSAAVSGCHCTATQKRWSELVPAPRVADSGADVVVANHWLALGGVARFARGAGLPLLVWTVDHPVLLRYWMHPGRAWLVTTNRPELALSLRDGD